MAQQEAWGTCQLDGKEVCLLTLTSEGTAAKVQVSTYGATLVSLSVPDSAGAPGDVLLGFDSLASYEAHQTYIGCAVGRVCSRIAGGTFRLGDAVHQLPQNNGTACHHGGHVGFNRHTWDVVESSRSSVTLRLESPDLDQGFPGRLAATVQYSLLPVAGGGAALSVRFRAETDKTTVVNLTNHAYFNLAGVSAGAGDARSLPERMLDHTVAIAADAFVPTDEGSIPLGELRSVAATPFDFREPTRVGARIGEEDEQLRIAQGYDHNYALREAPSGNAHGGTRALGVRRDEAGRWVRTRPPDAVAADAVSGRSMEVYTEEPAVHFYAGNYLGSEPPGKGGVPIERRAGFCFETQHFTDSPNQPGFPSVVLEPGQAWKTETVFWFPNPASTA
mmetsp:Transcript_1709/g.5497  ORF Transcript_1709/g.5497 Transcript_1709/m.5497 type:complete len:390 (+) Transcript_1709:80-1249(+)